MTISTQKFEADRELAAMFAISQAMAAFGDDDHETVGRIVAWFGSRYAQSTTVGGSASRPESRGSLAPFSGVRPEAPAVAPGGAVTGDLETVADMFAVVRPKAAFEKALAVAYWRQVQEGAANFTAAEINRVLRDLGHRINNITDALTVGMDKRPQLVVQLQKSGNSKQARKTYKITHAGIAWVRSRLTGQPEEADQE